MGFPRVRFSMRHLMILVAAAAIGFAIAPRSVPSLGAFLPIALVLASFHSWWFAKPAIAFLGFLSLVEVVMGEPVTAALYAPIAVLISGPLWPEGRWSERPKRLIPLLAVNVAILSLYLIPWTTRKPFLRDFYSIKTGMTVAEVRRRMYWCMLMEKVPAPGSNEERAFEGRLTFRHSDEPLLNCDFGVVVFRDGKVVDVVFLPD